MTKPASAGQASRNQWFEERRHLFVKNMFKGFCETSGRFLTMYEAYASSGSVSFAGLDALVGTESNRGLLWLLKDRCHQLWRDSDPEKELSGSLLDWVIGSIFHEAMKLKENTYMLQYYGPLAEAMQARSAAHTVKFCGDECHRFMARTREEVGHQMESLGFMFNRASLLMRALLVDQRENALLVRHLIENPAVAEQLWSEPLPTLLADMFPEGADHAFCLAARSYLAGDWHQEAKAAYSQALAVNPACEEAEHHIRQLEGLLRQRPNAAPALTA
ncbi:MAG: hypothetical protein AB1413_09240 [Thermodesulfobacteriota bacterium]